MSVLGLKYEFLKDNPLWKSIRPYYAKMIADIDRLTDPGWLMPRKDSVRFYAQNAKRVNAVANILADEQSKETYLGLIKFRQTRCKKDFPLSCCDGTQYFIKELKLGEDEVFIDCGAFIGDTIDEFLKCCSKYKQIIAFEPDAKNFRVLKDKHGNNAKISLINAAAYDKDGRVAFSECGNTNSRIIIGAEGEQGNFTSTQAKAIDSLNLTNVSFIKMDIEGAELSALKGAERTTRQQKPKLAICIYHSNEDMVSIAEYIHDLVPEYKLFIRQHGLYPNCYETVLYALMS